MSTENENENPLNKEGEVVIRPEGINSSFFDSIPKEGNFEEAKKEDNDDDKGQGGEDKGDEASDEDKADNKEDKKDEDDKSSTTSDKEDEDDDSLEDSVIHVLANAYEDVDLEGEFDDTPESLIKATNQIIKAKEDKAKAKGVEELYEEVPIVKDIVSHLKHGGSLLSLIQKQQIEDFSNITLTEDNLDEAERMFRLGLTERGLEEDNIELLINAAKDAGELVDKGKASQEYLVKNQKAIIDKQIADEKKQKEDDDKAALAEETSIRELISAKKVLSFDLDEATATRLEKFALTDERAKAYGALTTEEWLALDLQVMEKFKRINKDKEAKPTSKAVKFKVKASKPVGDKMNGGSTAVNSISDIGIKSVKDLFK